MLEYSTYNIDKRSRKVNGHTPFLFGISILLIINTLVPLICHYIHLVNHYAYRQVSHIGLLHPVTSGDFVKQRFLELAQNGTFLIKYIKATFVMK